MRSLPGPMANPYGFPHFGREEIDGDFVTLQTRVGSINGGRSVPIQTTPHFTEFPEQWFFQITLETIRSSGMGSSG